MTDSFRPMELEGRLIAGHYRLIRLLGEGGFGSVFHGQLELFEEPVRDVAVKVSKHPIPNKETAQTKFAEAILSAEIYDGINDPHAKQYIVPVLDLGIDREMENRGYIVMEIVMGLGSSPGNYFAPGTLEDQINHYTKGCPPDMALTFLKQICAGLAPIHEQGIVHNDLKPDNILLTNKGQIRIADFGLATKDRQLGTQLPTFRYMAPEIATNRTCYPSSDVYTLGIVLYRLLTHRHPDDVIQIPIGLSQEERHRRILETKKEKDFKIIAPSNDNPQVKPWLDRLVVDCLAFQENARPSNSRELLERIIKDAQLPPDPPWPPSDWANAARQLEEQVGHIDPKRSTERWFDLKKKLSLCYIELGEKKNFRKTYKDIELYIEKGAILRSYKERELYYSELLSVMRDRKDYEILIARCESKIHKR